MRKETGTDKADTTCDHVGTRTTRPLHHICNRQLWNRLLISYHSMGFENRRAIFRKTGDV